MKKEQNTATLETGHDGEERRTGARDRRSGNKDRRDPERTADEIAPRRHPDISGRRSYDR